MLNMNKTKMDFLIGVAKALLPQHTPTPRHTPALQFFFLYYYYCIASYSDWIIAGGLIRAAMCGGPVTGGAIQ